MNTNAVTIKIPTDIYNQISHLAEQEQRTVEEFLAESITDTFHKGDANEAEENARMAREESAYEAMHDDLVKTHLYHYVAIKDGVVVGADADELKLFFQLEEKYPNEVVLMRQVLPTLPPDLRIRSPRFEK